MTYTPKPPYGVTYYLMDRFLTVEKRSLERHTSVKVEFSPDYAKEVAEHIAPRKFPIILECISADGINVDTVRLNGEKKDIDNLELTIETLNILDVFKDIISPGGTL